MEYIIIVALLLFVGYKLIVRANRKRDAAGRDYLDLDSTDSLAFLAKPVNTLQSDDEFAAFNFLIMRPWRHTNEHFGRLLKLFDARSRQTDAEAEELYEMLLDDSGCTPTFAVLCKMAPLPERLADIAPQPFAAWTREHKAELEAAPNMSIGYFMNISSRAAAKAFWQLAHHRTSAA